ncbi:MAG: glycosyltransferase family 4 protein [Nodosilinea sp.]
MRVLLLAFECNPEWYSLPAVAYHYAETLAQHVDELVVVTQIQNKENIDKHGGIKGAEVVFLDVERVVRPFEGLAAFLMGGYKKNVGWTIYRTLMYPTYLYFEYVAWNRFKSELKNRKFDIVHRLTPMTPTLPSPMAQWSPVPFVLGPLNGGLRWPNQFASEQSREREWLSDFRNAYKLLPYQKSSYKGASAILAAFNHTIADLSPSLEPKIINFPEVGIDPELFNLPIREPKEKVTVLYVGRLVPYKMPEVVIQAFANSKVLQQHQLLMVGDGAERPRLEAMIQEKSLAHCVQLLGQVSHQQVSQLMREAEIFAFPSIRELGAGAVIEAMACGLTCVVVDYGGCGGLVDADRGVKVPMGDTAQLVQAFTDALEKLVQAPERVKALGQAAYAHAIAHYAWEAKAQKNVEVYNWVLGKQAEKPNFWRTAEAPVISDSVYQGEPKALPSQI